MSGLLNHREGLCVDTPIDGGPPVCSRVFVCCHCNHAWKEVKGSGIQRGFCLLCMARTCGSPRCDPCIPVEKRLENLEAGRDYHAEPTTVSVSTAGIHIVGG